MTIRRRRFFLVFCSAAIAAGCAGLGGPHTVTLTQPEIERLVERKFPLERRLAEVFDVTVQAPSLRLLPERNRLAAVVEVQARDRLFGATWQARLDFDAALRWNEGDQTVRLSQVRVQDLALANPTAAERSAVERVAAALAERVLEDFSLYRLPPERAARIHELGVVPAAVTVTSRGVEVTFAASAR